MTNMASVSTEINVKDTDMKKSVERKTNVETLKRCEKRQPRVCQTLETEKKKKMTEITMKNWTTELNIWRKLWQP